MSDLSRDRLAEIRAVLNEICLDSLEQPLEKVIEHPGDVIADMFIKLYSLVESLAQERDEALAAVEVMRNGWGKYEDMAVRYVRASEELNRLREAHEAFYNDEAILAGTAAVRRMLIMRVGGLRDHASAFREAALAAGTETTT